MAEFKARAYGKKTAKVMCGKEEILEAYHPTGTAFEFCRKVAVALNELVDDALFNRGRFEEKVELEARSVMEGK